jgi:general stress protein YciG
MNRDQQRRIASKGGKAAHEKGAAHEWTPQEARAAGRKGGVASHHQAAARAAADEKPDWPYSERTREAEEAKAHRGGGSSK